MEELDNKFDTINLVTNINELMAQTEVTQYFKNTKNTPIELEMIIPKLSNINLTRFEMTLQNKKVVSKLIENNKAKEKYTDTIASGNCGFLSYSSQEEISIFLGNIPSNEEIKLKTYFFGHIIPKDYSYQASFPVIFPGFILTDPENRDDSEIYKVQKQIVKGKIYINTFSKLTRLIIKGSKNFGKIEQKFGKDFKSVDIDIYKNNFSEKDIPGIIIFRTEDINKDKIFYQYGSNKEKYYYLLQKTLEIPKIDRTIEGQIDKDENINYASLLKTVKKNENNNNYKKCFIFLLDQSGSMSGGRIELCCKALLLFLQSLDENCYFQLIGFGSDYEYYTTEPLEYNKENITKLMDIIRNLGADKGGTELYEPLDNIFNNIIYEKYDMIKHIFLLTDGKIDRKEDTLNLIGSHSDKFTFHSIGIGDCDKDLIERSAILGNGYSYFLENLDNLNKVIISALEKSQSETKIKCESGKKYNIEDKKEKYIKINDFFRHGVITDNKIDKINFIIKYNKKEIKISSKKIKVTKLPNGEELGKLIIDNYLLQNKSLDFRTKIKLSKDYNILCSETAFFAEIQNEIPIKEKMSTITNKNKEIINNNNIIEIESEKNKEAESELRYIGYESTNNYFNINDNEIIINEHNNKKGFLSCIYSIFTCKKEKNKIINKKLDIPNSDIVKYYSRSYSSYSFHDKISNKKNYIRSEKKEKKRNIRNIKAKKYKINYSCDINYEKNDEKENDIISGYKKPYKSINRNSDYSCDNLSKSKDCKKNDEKDIDIISKSDNCDEKRGNKKPNKSINRNSDYSCDNLSKSNDCKKNDEKVIINFDEIILSQDIIEGNWKSDNQSKILIEEEKDLYEKVKKLSESKGISNDEAIITLFILYYIFNKKSEKVEELKFVINKAKNYIKKKFNLDYDEIAQELDNN